MVELVSNTMHNLLHVYIQSKLNCHYMHVDPEYGNRY